MLTIAGERLAWSRMLRLSVPQQVLFLVAVSIVLAGLLLLVTAFAAGVRLTGVGMVVLAGWFLRYDMARRTRRHPGVPRFMVVWVLSGYGWLALGGALTWFLAGIVAGPYDDAMLHTVFLGFVLAMIFAHVPLMVPAILGRATSPSHPALYGLLWLLHASLLLRVTGDLMGWWSGRQWGGLLNALAVLLFVITLAWVLRRGRSMLLRRKRFVRGRALMLPRRKAPGMAPTVTPA